MTDADAEYNAVVTEVRFLHDALMILRIQPDDGISAFHPGQYTTLGLRSSEPRNDQVPAIGCDPPRLIRRAYSISHPLIDGSGTLVAQRDCDFLEFYVALVRRSDDTPPPLTPRLFHLRAGRRIFMDSRARGHYTLDSVEPDDDVVFAATGTGEAPHNAMLASLLDQNHQGRIVSMVSVRWQQDLGYAAAHRELERQFSNYRYLPLTTREQENTDPNQPGFVGKLYLQDVFSSDTLVDRLGWELTPSRTHVFLCGSPVMIGLPVHAEDGDVFPTPVGMAEVLTRRGFRLDRPRSPGNLHIEKYW